MALYIGFNIFILKENIDIEISWVLIPLFSMEIYYNAQTFNEVTCAGFVIKNSNNKICLVKSKSGGKFSFPKGTLSARHQAYDST